MWTANWDGGFVVGGDDTLRLTPHFRLKEFRNGAAPVRVHRELVSALEILRQKYGQSLSVRSTDASGLGVRVSAASVPGLLAAAEAVGAHRLFSTVTQENDVVHLVIPDPANLPEIELEQALESAFSVTSGFETAGDRFQQVTGNFDGAGLSFGPVQWNFGMGTLPPVFRAFEQADAAALRRCFTDTDDWDEFQRILKQPFAQQVAWADRISTGRGKQEVSEPWRGYFHAVGLVPRFRAVMVELALREYGGLVLEAILYLQGLAPNVHVDHLRCICSLYDLAIQQKSLTKAKPAIEARVKQEQPKDQFHLVRIAVEERGRTASTRWQADCVSRRVGILKGVPETVDGHQHANLNFFLLRDVRIRDAHNAVHGDVETRLAKVADALANGSTLLA